MPRRSRLQAAADRYKDEVRQSIIRGNIVNAVGILDPLPPRDNVREVLRNPPFNILDRSFRVILVEDLGDYKVYIQVPGEKTEYDFFVWRAIFRDNTLVDLKVPSHDDLGKMYLSLRNRSPILEEHLINATLRFIRDRYPLRDVIARYFSELPEDLLQDVEKFLLTLKWIALQEDANYPPPQLGSLYALAVYAILEISGDLSAIRKIIRFKGG